MGRPTISAVVLTHNDESVISKCLESLAWCDEVVVIDDESTDETAAIVRKHGVRVVSRKLDDDFAAQRNFGLKHAKNDWVLFVDSDEVVSKSLAKEIMQVIEMANDKLQMINGYKIKRADF